MANTNYVGMNNEADVTFESELAQVVFVSDAVVDSTDTCGEYEEKDVLELFFNSNYVRN